MRSYDFSKMVEKKYEIQKDQMKSELMDHVKALSIPRLVGSEGEEKAKNYIKHKIKEYGYTPNEEDVPTSTYKINFLQGVSNFMMVLLFLASAWLFSINPLWFLISIAVIFINIWLVSTGSVGMSQAPYVPKPWKNNIIHTQNLWAELKHDEKEDSKNEIIFVGHYDSKSTKVNGLVRVLSYGIMLACAIGILITGIIGIILYLINQQPNSLLNVLIWVIGAVGALMGAILTGNIVGNKSPGSADNATAVSILLEAMRYFKNHPPAKANITFLFSAAEEIGLTGAYYFIKRRFTRTRFSPDHTFIINYDMAGAEGKIILNEAIGIPKKHCSKMMTGLLDDISEEQDIPYKKVYLPVGGWTDAIPFIERGYETTTLSGGPIHDVHSTKDDISIIDEDNLFKSLILGIELAKTLEKKNLRDP